MTRLLRSLTLLLALVASPARADYETAAHAAIVIDLSTDTILLEKNADEQIPPASMSKLMTLDLLFEALSDGRITMDTEFGVSAKAHGMGGSKMFLAEGSRVPVKDLIQGIIVDSGNDACIVVAEGLAGSEQSFVALMNKRAQALGLTNAHFDNASGWPDPKHHMSVRDLSILATRMIRHFPDYYHFFSEESFTWEGITQRNRNPLIGLGIGADGLKTGHTEEAGYGLVGSAVDGDRRILFVAAGLPSIEARAREGEQIVNWAFHQFVEKKIVSADTRLATAPVWMGKETKVGIVAPKDVTVLLPAIAQGTPMAEVTYNSPLEAPVTKGEEIASLVVKRPGLPDAVVPLVADRDIARGGFLPRVRSSAHVLMGMLGERVKGLF